MHSATMLMNWCRRTVGSFPVFPLPLSPTVRRIVALSHPFDYYSPSLFKEWSADIFLSRSVGRPFFIFYSVGYMSAFRAGSFFFFSFSAAIRSRSSSAGGDQCPAPLLVPVSFILFFFPASSSSSYGTTGERMGE